MIGLPHRVGAAYVVFGQDEGSKERDPEHILNPSVYGGGFHTYFKSYPETTPSPVIVKVAGTLGLNPASAGVDYSSETLPRNFLTIVCYKTELNHNFPDLAATGYDWQYDSSTCVQTFPDGVRRLNDYLPSDYFTVPSEIVYLPERVAVFNSALNGSFKTVDDVTDLLGEDPPDNVETYPLYPRWTDEDGWDRVGFQLSPALRITPEYGDPYWQTRDGGDVVQPGSQTPADFISPWRVAYGKESGSLYQQTQLLWDFSYKFTSVGEYAVGSTPYSIVHPWNPRGSYNPADATTFNNAVIADHGFWQYDQDAYGNTSNPYPTGAYRAPWWIVNVTPDNTKVSSVAYESKSTHGLFLTANGSCWNIGTELMVKVHIWKCPPKPCFFPNHQIDTVKYPYASSYAGHPWSYTNWEVGGVAWYTEEPFNYKYYAPSRYYDNVPGWINVNLPGPLTGRGTFEDPIIGFQTGKPTGMDYDGVPLQVNMHYWGCAFTPDYENGEEHEVLEFTVVVDESNTKTCDGQERPGVNYTQFGFKLEDIELPVFEGLITYIKDFEVTSVKKPGA